MMSHIRYVANYQNLISTFEVDFILGTTKFSSSYCSILLYWCLLNLLFMARQYKEMLMVTLFCDMYIHLHYI